MKKKVEIFEDIERKEWEKSLLQRKIKDLRNEIDEIEEHLCWLYKLKNTIESHITNLAEEVLRNSEPLSRHNRYKARYREETKRIFNGRKVKSSIEKINSSIQKLRRKEEHYVEEVEELKRKISFLESEIYSLRKTLEGMYFYE